MKTSYRQQENEGDTRLFKVRLPVADGRVAVFLSGFGRKETRTITCSKEEKQNSNFPKALLRLLLRAIGID
jgi:hypothetical protein